MNFVDRFSEKNADIKISENLPGDSRVVRVTLILGTSQLHVPAALSLYLFSWSLGGYRAGLYIVEVTTG